MSAEYLRSYLRAIDETPLEMQLGVTQLTNQDFEAIELVKQISDKIEETKRATTEEERFKHNLKLKDLFKKMLYRVQMQGEISTELGLRINATQRELGAERGHWESGAYIKREAEANYKLLNPDPPAVVTRPESYAKHAAEDYMGPAKKKKTKTTKKKVRQQEYCRWDCTLAEGEMVGCDTEEGCPHGEWFHLVCVGLRQSPPADKKWYCPECRAAGIKRR
mmetsp:Transcript_146526/g.207789  ORF Transcript_146526/g.207789 Transcript_146526/m.207789 type:complete len:221 (-) Transcript_146526:45-707(-)